MFFFKAKSLSNIFQKLWEFVSLSTETFFILSFKHHEEIIRTIRGLYACRMHD